MSTRTMLSATLVFSLPLFGSLTSPMPASLDSPASPACWPHRLEAVVTFTGAPNLGGVSGGLQVTQGSLVELHGVAEARSLSTNCVFTRTPLPFTWTLQLVPRGGSPTDATAQLSAAGTLSPTFSAAELGTYYVQLVAGSLARTMPVEVIRNGLEWMQIGPDGTAIPASTEIPSTGRVNVLAFDPINPNILYAGAQLGGVFKSNNRGGSWFPMSDHKGWPSLAVSALATASDGTVYAGVGGTRLNYAYNQTPGAGIMKSVDEGITWVRAGASTAGCPAGSVAMTDLIYRILPNPSNPAIVYAAGVGGLYRSTNAGQCWQPLPIGFGGVTDLAYKPGDANTLYVAMPPRGLLKSTNATSASPFFNPLTVPLTQTYNRILLAVSPAQPTVLYASFTSGTRSDFVKYTSDGAASSVRGTRAGQRCFNPVFSYCDYATALAVKPDDADRLFSTEVSAWQSLNGGMNWATLHTYPIHDDVQGLQFAPDDPNTLYAATDGGVYRITLAPRGNLASQGSWQARNQGLAVAAGGTLGIAPSNSNKGALAMWDNGSKRRLSGHVWKSFGDNDGFTVAMDAFSADTIYFMPSANAGVGASLSFARYHLVSSYSGGMWVESNDGPGDIGRVQPGYDLFADPAHAGRVFGIGVSNSGGLNPRTAGKLYVTYNAHTSSTANWICADPQPGGSASLYALEFGRGGTYFASYTDGRVYSFTLPSSLPAIANCAAGSTAAQGVSLLYTQPSGQAIRVTVDPSNSGALFAVVPNAYGAGRVLRLTRPPAGGTWTALQIGGSPTNTHRLPTVNFGTFRRNSVAFAADPSVAGTLWLGTTSGLWMGEPQRDGDYAWTLDPYVPETEVTEIVPHRNTSGGFTGVLQLVTFGRSVWERRKPPPLYFPGVENICVPCVLFDNGIMPIPDPRLKLAPAAMSDRYALLSAAYNYDGSAGSQVILQITPMLNGKDITLFQGGSTQVSKGNGFAFVDLAFAGDNLPLGQFVDSLRIDLLSAVGQAHSASAVINSTVVPFEKLWLRDDARSLSVEALAVGSSAFEAQASFNVQVGADTPISETGHIQLPVPDGSTVIINAPSTVNTPEGVASFIGWVIDGSEQVGTTKLQLTVSANTRLAALYELPESVEYFPQVHTLYLPSLMR